MTPETHTAPARAGLVGKGKWLLKILTGIVAVIAAGGWVSVGIGLFVLKVPQQTGLILLVVTALATEALIWTVAALLGLTVFEARKRIWRRLTGRKTGGAQ